MKTTVIEKAKRIIDLRRFDAENKAVENKIKAFDDNIFKKLYQTYTTYMIEYSREGKEIPANVKDMKNKFLNRLKEINRWEKE